MAKFLGAKFLGAKILNNNEVRENGNALLAIFGAIAVSGVLGASLMAFMNGPLQSSTTLARQNAAETQLTIAGQAAIMSATTSGGGDCDADGMIEPPEWRTPGTLPAPTGGGLIPLTIGIAKKDTWGTDYGYCVWDHGANLLSAGCRGTVGVDKRLSGTNSRNYISVALISAGPNKTFTTTCRSFTAADVNANGQLGDTGDLLLVSKAASTDDDIIFARSYAQASGLSGGLWNVKAGDASKATIAKDIAVTGGAAFSGVGNFKRIGSTSGDYLEILSALKLSGPSVVAVCNATNKGILRANTAGTGVEICNGVSTWNEVGSSVAAVPPQNKVFVTSISYTGNMGGIAGADALCQARASAGGLSGTYKAWLSDSSGSSPATRFVKSSADYVGTTGLVIANGWGDLTDGTLDNPIEVNESGIIDVSTNSAHTATTISGTYDGLGNTCTNWTLTSGNGGRGDKRVTNSNWTVATGSPGQCNNNIRLYCFQQDGDPFGWPLQAPDGSASAPSYSFANSTGTGLWFATGAMKVSATGAIDVTGTSANFAGPTTNFRLTSAGGIKIGDDSGACSGTTEGTIKFNSDTNAYQYCNGASWTALERDTTSNKWTAISVGGLHSCGIKADGSAWCWGDDSQGQLGNGTTITANQASPSLVSGGDTWTSISAGGSGTCGIKSDNTAWCWGRNWEGQLGDGTQYTFRYVPTALSGGGAWRSISFVSSVYGCGIKSDGNAYCWGDGAYGKLGNGGTATFLVPTVVSNPGPWLNISAAGLSTCAIKADGSAWCWGYDGSSGSLGNGASVTADQYDPYPVSGAGPWKLTQSGGSNCGIKADGTAFCWGTGNSGQIGDGGGLHRDVPSAVSGGATWSAITTGAYHTCGIKTNGTVWCWGSNGNGQAGSSNGGIGSKVPVSINGTNSNWVKISASTSNTCGIKADGSAWCWGSDSKGQLGNGSSSTTDQNTPVKVQ